MQDELERQFEQTTDFKKLLQERTKKAQDAKYLQLTFSEVMQKCNAEADNEKFCLTLDGHIKHEVYTQLYEAGLKVTYTYKDNYKKEDTTTISWE